MELQEILIVCTAFIASSMCVLIFIRNDITFKYRGSLNKELLDYIHSQIDIVGKAKLLSHDQGVPCEMEYPKVELLFKLIPSYSRMLYSFWVWDWEKFGTLETMLEQSKK